MDISALRFYYRIIHEGADIYPYIEYYKDSCSKLTPQRTAFPRVAFACRDIFPLFAAHIDKAKCLLDDIRKSILTFL
jgi:hypothetical protein